MNKYTVWTSTKDDWVDPFKDVEFTPELIEKLNKASMKYLFNENLEKNYKITLEEWVWYWYSNEPCDGVLIKTMNYSKIVEWDEL